MAAARNGRSGLLEKVRIAGFSVSARSRKRLEPAHESVSGRADSQSARRSSTASVLPLPLARRAGVHVFFKFMSKNV